MQNIFWGTRNNYIYIPHYSLVNRGDNQIMFLLNKLLIRGHFYWQNNYVSVCGLEEIDWE